MNARAQSGFQSNPSLQLITVPQAAKLLSVHVSTIRRWITNGKLPAYRVGDKGVRVRQDDLFALLTPMTNGRQTLDRSGDMEQFNIPRLTDEEQEQALAAIDEAVRVQAVMLAERGGKFFPPSWELINEERDKRTRQLMGDDSE